MAHCSARICQSVTVSGDAERPKVADAVIEALTTNTAQGTARNESCKLAGIAIVK